MIKVDLKDASSSTPVHRNSKFQTKGILYPYLTPPLPTPTSLGHEAALDDDEPD